MARKKYAGNAAIQAKLDSASDLLAALNIASATELFDSTAPAGDYDADGDVDTNDYSVWRSAFGSATILHGSGADGNYDGFVDAADYLVWRKSLGIGAMSAMATEAAVPEPATSALMTLLAITACCCRIWHPSQIEPT